MNRKLLGVLATALLGVSTLAAAHDRDGWRGDGGRHDGRTAVPANGYGNGYSNGYGRERGWRAAERTGYYARAWRRGDRLPAAYYARPYVIADYPRYRLYAPPRGYQWVRVDGGDLLLAAIATGLVLDVLHDFAR
jgi:Ni/Co efflux regulator RcnB